MADSLSIPTSSGLTGVAQRAHRGYDSGDGLTAYASVWVENASSIGGGGGGSSSSGPSTPQTSYALAAGTGTITVVGIAGVLYGILVTSIGTQELDLFDGSAGGTQIGLVPENTPLGFVYMPCPVPFNIGLFSNGGANTPGVTLFFTT